MKGTRLFWQSILVVAFAAVGTLFAAQTGDALKPQGDFKHWYLVHSTLITKDDNKLGLIAGVHLIYVNAAGLDRLKRGGSTPYPDGTMFSDDVRDYSGVDGVYVQGATGFSIGLLGSGPMCRGNSASVQWRARPHGNAGIHGDVGIVESVSYRI
jgi:hypothetical protein